MALTEHCDIFAAVNESAVRRVLTHVTHQRPALVNYGSPGVVARPDLLCNPLDAHPVAVARGNTLITSLPPLPVVLTDNPALAMEWCFQLSKAALDVHPGNAIALPPELAPLGEQRLAGQLAVCAGLGCPDDRLVALLPVPGLPAPKVVDHRKDREPPRRYPPITVPTRGLRCFCLEADIVAGADFFGPAGNQHFRALLAALEIVDLAPQNMEDAIECYAKMAVRFGLLPKLAVPVVRFTTNLFGFAQLAIEPTVASASVPNNPALEDNSVTIFLDLTTSSITGGGGGGTGGGSGGSAPPSFPGVDRPRSRSGAFDLQAALSERAVQELFDVVLSGKVKIEINQQHRSAVRRHDRDRGTRRRMGRPAFLGRHRPGPDLCRRLVCRVDPVRVCGTTAQTVRIRRQARSRDQSGPVEHFGQRVFGPGAARDALRLQSGPAAMDERLGCA